MIFSDKLSLVVFCAVCVTFVFSLSADANQVPQPDVASVIGIVPSSDVVFDEDDVADEEDALDEEKRAMPGVMRFGKRGGMPGVLRFGKRAMPGVMRFGKKAMPGVMRFGKKSMPGVMRFGKRMEDDEGIEGGKRKGPAPIRFG